MKQIYNWHNATVFDVEADDLLDGATMLHVLSYQMEGGEVKSIKGDNHKRIRDFFKFHIDNNIPVAIHNGDSFDRPVIEKLLGVDLSELMLIDTLFLSFYLNIGRQKHGLDSFFVDYNIKKPKIKDGDWKLPERKPYNTDKGYETTLGRHYWKMKHRCQEDVKINKALWEDFKERLIDMYSKVKAEVDSLNVGGKRVSQDEVIYIDRYVNNSSVDQYIDRFLSFIALKSHTARVREATKIKLDVGHVKEVLSKVEALVEDAKAEVESVMPKVPKYGYTNYPAKPRLNLTDKQKAAGQEKGDLSSAGKTWNKHCDNRGKYDDRGNILAEDAEPFDSERTEELEDGTKVKVPWPNRQRLRVLKKYEAPNANSPEQVKAFLFSKGWQPETFKFERDEEAFQMWVDSGFRGERPAPRKIPQITKDGDGGKVLCASVERLAEEVPEIQAYSNYGMLKHRKGLLKGFLRDGEESGTLTAGVKGLTNTLREQHREIVNLPGVDKAYGEDLRGSLIAGKGKIALGSDLSSLEDRVKHHFMIAHDPDYVKTMMADDFDPHLLMAVTAGMITEQQMEDYKAGNKDGYVTASRKKGKATNYSSVYGAGAETIARSAGVSNKEGKTLREAYWKLNWSVEAIADDQCVITDKLGKKWLINPINGFCYSLRADKDRFSTLCQGTGSFFFDMWIANVLTSMKEEFGVERLSLLMHDEYMVTFKDTPSNRETMEKVTHDAIEKVNQEFLLRRSLGCDVQFGDNYGQIH